MVAMTIDRLAGALDGADLSSLVGRVVGASIYVALTARSRRPLRAGGQGTDAAAVPVSTVMSVE